MCVASACVFPITDKVSDKEELEEEEEDEDDKDSGRGEGGDEEEEVGRDKEDITNILEDAKSSSIRRGVFKS